jgi:hypothetical protein
MVGWGQRVSKRREHRNASNGHVHRLDRPNPGSLQTWEEARCQRGDQQHRRDAAHGRRNVMHLRRIDRSDLAS